MKKLFPSTPSPWSTVPRAPAHASSRLHPLDRTRHAFDLGRFVGVGESQGRGRTAVRRRAGRWHRSPRAQVAARRGRRRAGRGRAKRSTSRWRRRKALRSGQQQAGAPARGCAGRAPRRRRGSLRRAARRRCSSRIRATRGARPPRREGGSPRPPAAGSPRRGPGSRDVEVEQVGLECGVGGPATSAAGTATATAAHAERGRRRGRARRSAPCSRRASSGSRSRAPGR